MVAGYAPTDGRRVRLGPGGSRLHAEQAVAASEWPSRTTSDGSLVWIEREGAEHANDAIVLERLALADGAFHVPPGAPASA